MRDQHTRSSRAARSTPGTPSSNETKPRTLDGAPLPGSWRLTSAPRAPIAGSTYQLTFLDTRTTVSAPTSSRTGDDARCWSLSPPDTQCSQEGSAARCQTKLACRWNFQVTGSARRSRYALHVGYNYRPTLPPANRRRISPGGELLTLATAARETAADAGTSTLFESAEGGSLEAEPKGPDQDADLCRSDALVRGAIRSWFKLALFY